MRMSLRVFGTYVLLAGAGFFLAPGPLVSLFRLPAGDPLWPRLVGLLVFVLGGYYVSGDRAFARASVSLRAGFALVVLGLVATGAPVTLLAFAVVDVLGLCWTAWALRAEGRVHGSAVGQDGAG